MNAAPDDARLLDRLDRAFAAHAGDDAAIDARELQQALKLRSAYLAKRVLALLDANGDGVVRRDEFLAGVRALVFGSTTDKLAFAFRLHDHDGDGALTRDEMHRMVAMGLAEAEAPVRPGQLEHLVAVLFAHADRDRDGRISFAEFDAAIRRRPKLLAAMTRSEARWIAPDEELLEHLLTPPRPRTLRLLRTLANRRAAIAWATFLVLATVVLVVDGALSVRGHGTLRSEAFWALSRACTTAMPVGAALILVPVLRRFVGWLRGTIVGRALPVDDAQDFHRAIGNGLYALTCGHVFAAVADIAARDAGLASLARPQVLSGLLWFVVFTVLWAFAQARVRRSGRFEVFHRTHLLYVAWFALAALHAPSLLGFAALPLVAFVVELALRRSRRGRAVAVRSLEPLAGGVTRVELETPPGFHHRAGDWLFLRVPHVARSEWHPFTISSAPERDTLTLHVRTLGNWTAALHRHASGAATAREVFTDGPYGSPAAGVFGAKVPVLIGAGIGVTPFASVLESLLWRARAGETSASLQRAHFFWLNRELYAFEWFHDLLVGLARDDVRGRLSAQIWLTGGHAGASALGLELARDLVDEGGGDDPVSGLRTRMHMGHPDWRAELEALRAAHAPVVPEVFFCGPPGLGRTLRRVCADVGLPYREERF